MRAFLIALALAGAFTLAAAPMPVMRVAQLSRDVTDAVRKQRAQQRVRPPAPERAKPESKR